MIPISPIKNITMSPEFILAICWLGLTFIVLALDTLLSVKNLRVTIPAAAHYGFLICHCLLCCATNYWLSLQPEWGTGRRHADHCPKSWSQWMWLLWRWALVTRFSFSDFFLNGGEGDINSMLSQTDNNELNSVIIFRNEYARVSKREN